MHFTSSNLLHDFPNGKYILFYLLKKNYVKNMIDPTIFFTKTTLEIKLFGLPKS